MILGVALCGCAATQHSAAGGADVLFSGSLQELVPIHDGDEFVYRVSGSGDQDGRYVQRISAPGSGQNIMATLGKEGAEQVAVATFLRSDGTSLVIVREELRAMDLVIVYDRPLPYVSVPVRSGVSEASTTVSLNRLSTNETIATGQAQQTLTITRGPAGAGPDIIALRTERRVQLADRVMQAQTGTWLKPGIGALVSEGRSDNGPITHQQLLCATIDGNRIGSCDRPLENSQ